MGSLLCATETLQILGETDSYWLLQEEEWRDRVIQKKTGRNRWEEVHLEDSRVSVDMEECGNR